ncbi:MAG: DUF4118 domain-containing protein [Bryobacteraceae bacterium]|nr:DUF4118 domain-containing protein [Bryobacteraceae bacterium]
MDESTERLAALVPESRARAAGNLWTIHRRLWSAPPARWRGYAGGAASVILVTLCAYRLHLNLSTSGSLCFLIVVLASGVWGFWEASVTSLIAVGCLNYFFVPPVMSWVVPDPQNWVALAAFEISALTVSRLSTRMHSQARAETQQRVQLEKLYELSRRILFLDRRQRTGTQIVSLIQELFQTESVAIFDAALARVDAAGPRAVDVEQLARRAYFQDCTLEGADAHTWAHVLRLGSKPAGAIAFSGPQVDLLTIEPIASLAAIALERARSFENESRADAARQAEQLRTAVLDALAHAFKTPLTAILTASSGLLEAGRLCADDAELAALIDEQGEHLNCLTTELLQMARIDAAEVRLRRERISVLLLIEDVIARYREQLGGRRVDISGAPSQLEVYGDRAILKSALEQFVDNACRYSTPGSPISVRAEESLGEIVIAIHNEGPPIRSADRERIFERFFRAEESRHRAPGTGLGLSIAKKAAQAHDGRTWVVSEEHSGTTFFLALRCGIRR